MGVLKRHGRSGIYLLPNLFTTASLFAAFYSLVASLRAEYDVAAIAIFIGIIADGLDGRIARMTNTQSAFGAEYDSLSDMVTFGVAPALLFYSWSLHQLNKFGWLVSFIFAASVALRLARFNTQLETADKRYFQGLACTPAAGFLASFCWLCHQNQWEHMIVSLVAAGLVIITALLMVSNIRYHSFKELDFKGKVPFLHVLAIVIFFAAIAANPTVVLFGGFSLYVLSGPLQTLVILSRVRKLRRRGKGRRKP
ncbi:MAG: CDP-diacylglycerol--serine O-phosphatidyltransferase [Legionellales bacterium]|nr:CDP-diacylglycerol--serine O-phosphatidyltransferase [Legionellales bacterium]